MPDPPHRAHWSLWLLVAAALYVGVSCAVFAFRHPWLTQTQRTLHIGDALAWRTLPARSRPSDPPPERPPTDHPRSTRRR